MEILKYQKKILNHFTKFLKLCHSISFIPGLVIIPNFITEKEEKQLIKDLNNEEWSTALKRRTQHYGYEYSYNKKGILPAKEFPDFIQNLKDKIQPLLKTKPNQVIVNEYDPGQGIESHTDDVKYFKSEIAGLSISSQCCMLFTFGEYKIEVLLPRRSLLIMKDDARYLWKHGIIKRKSDMENGKRIKRTKRISITFRTVKSEYKP